ncbi:MAG: MFS transporter [Clostridia bacterium]|nr:MFS transporter [Clostridia bacterium]
MRNLNGLLSRLQVDRKYAPLVLAMYGGFAVNGAGSILLGAILPDMKSEYGLSYAVSGAALSAHQVGNFLALVAMGVLPYLLGRRKTMCLLWAGIALGFAGFTLTGNPLLVLFSFLLTGVGRGAVSTMATVTISEVSGAKAAAQNMLHASFAVGAVLSPLLAMACLGLNVGWRPPVWAVALLGAVTLVSFWRAGLSDTPEPRTEGTGREFLRSGSYWLNIGILFFYLCGESSIMGWLVTYFTDAGIMSGTLAQFTSTILWVMVLAGRLLCAAYADRVGRSRLLVVMVLGMTVCFAAMISTRNVAVVLASLAGMGLFMSGTFPTTMSTMEPRFANSPAATSFAIAAAAIGSVAMPMAVGQIAQLRGIVGGISAIAVTQAVLVALVVVKWVRDRKAGCAR